VPEPAASDVTENFDEIQFDFGNVGAFVPVYGARLFPEQRRFDASGGWLFERGRHRTWASGQRRNDQRGRLELERRLRRDSNRRQRSTGRLGDPGCGGQRLE
jgi:hypothetical protein